MATAALDPASGWVSGVVGIHPWLLAFADARVQEEVWGDDTETWIASPFSRSGVARPVERGYIFDGRWQFSSGTDHCDWIFLGAMPQGSASSDDLTARVLCWVRSRHHGFA